MGIGRFIKNEKGYALPLVLIVIVVITILGTTLLLISMTQLKHVSIEENRMQAHYYARSGAELVMFGIGDEPGQLKPQDIPVGEASALVSNEISFNGDSLAGNITLIKVYRENNDIIIVSTGSVNGVSETLELRLGNVGEEVIRHWVRVQ